MGSLKGFLAQLFSLSALIVTGLVGILLGVVEFGLFVRLPLLFLVLIYIIWITSNYFFEIIEFKALGNPQWPTFSLETLVGGRNQLGILFSSLALAAAGGYVALRELGLESPAQMLLVAAFLLLPGFLALLAVSRNLLAALSPARILSAAIGMGRGYLYCLIGAAAVYALIRLAEARGGLYFFASTYGIFVYAFLIGSVVYSRRNALGVTAPRSPEARAEKLRAETVATRNAILTQAYGFATRGNKAGALRHLEAYLSTDEDTLEARLWMLNQIARWEDSYVPLEFGRRLIDYCERYGLAAEAARVRMICDHLRGAP